MSDIVTIKTSAIKINDATIENWPELPTDGTFEKDNNIDDLISEKGTTTFKWNEFHPTYTVVLPPPHAPKRFMNKKGRVNNRRIRQLVRNQRKVPLAFSLNTNDGHKAEGNAFVKFSKRPVKKVR